MNQDQIDTYNQEQQDTAKEQALIDLQQNNTDSIVQTVATSGLAIAKVFQQSIDKLIEFQKTNTTVTVDNQNEPVETVHTPDIQQVVDALKELQATITNEKPDDSGTIAAINELNNSIKSFIVEIPEPIETVTVKNQVDYSKELKDLKKSVDNIELKPVINLPDTPDDYSSIVDELAKVITAVKEIQFPDTKLDLTPLIQSTDSVQKAIAQLKFPIPNYVLPFKDSTGKATQAPIPLLDLSYDYVGMSNADGNGNYQTVVYKTGGAAGTTVRTLAYTFDASSNVTSITRS